ncbi:MAG: glycoside hydrolase family 3 N-terminal domain-containing protein [bacterium]|nr:glycoside hydrolase family 3 N-terminal domain-containing protein [bacterium]
MKKKIFAVILSLATVTGMISAFAEFEDVAPDSWYSEAVSFMVQSGYMNGVSETEFAPDASMTRGMFVTVLGRMDGTVVSEYNKKIFPDVEIDKWYAPYVSWAVENGIVSGFDDLTFHPEEEINRAQLSVMLKRYIDYRGYEIADNPAAYDSYIDEASIPQWSKDGADLVRRSGLITGDSYGAFMPMSSANRAQIAATIMRLRMLLNGEILDIPERKVRSKTETLLDEMSLKDKIYQMIAVTPEQLTGVNTATMAGSVTEDAIKRYPVGMVVYTGKNILSAEQIKTMVANTSSYFEINPFAAISEEPGQGAQLASRIGTDTFKDAYDYRMSDPSEIKSAYSNLSIQLKNCGFNVNLAPTADLWSNPANTYISKRAFGNTYSECSPHVVAAIEGIKENSVLSAMKYFPGYGSSAQNPLDGDCRGNLTVEDLKNYDFNTYKDGIDAGADIVICANILMYNIDDKYPASMSEKIIGDLLKNELSFKGIVMTDDLRIKSIAQKFKTSEIAVTAIEAGCDILMCPPDLDEAVSAVVQAVKDEKISEARINESVYKILETKEKAGIL